MKLKAILGGIVLTSACIVPTTYAVGLPSPMELNQEATLLDVTIPLSLPVHVDSLGNVVIANNLEIRNKSYGAIEVQGIEVSGKNSWTLSDFDKDFSSERVGLKEFGFKINNEKVARNGYLPISKNKYVVNGESNKVLTYDVSVAPQKDAIFTDIADVTLTIDWYGDSNVDYVKLTEKDFEYVTATDEELIDEGILEHFVYNGTEEYVEIPDVIDGRPVITMDGMFLNNKSVKGVKLPNTDIESMNFTFKGCSSLEEVSELPQSIKTLDRTFSGCTSMEVAPKLPLNLDSKEGLTSTFRDCTNLKVAPEIPENIVYLKATFADCHSLEYAPELPSNTIHLFYTFKNCYSLKVTPEIPNTVKYMQGTFRGCDNLTDIPIIPNTVTEMSELFRSCDNLTGTLTVPSGVKYMTDIFRSTVKPITMEYNRGNTIAESVSVPSNVTKVVID